MGTFLLSFPGDIIKEFQHGRKTTEENDGHFGSGIPR
jgi:hypothetical protein